MYDGGNKRISTMKADVTQSIYIYGAMGEKLSVWRQRGIVQNTSLTNNLYFAGRLIKQNTDSLYYR